MLCGVSSPRENKIQNSLTTEMAYREQRAEETLRDPYFFFLNSYSIKSFYKPIHITVGMICCKLK